MEKYEFRVYDEDLNILGRGIEGSRAAAEHQKEWMAKHYRSVGYKVRETDIVRVRLITTYAEDVDLTFILREYCSENERFSLEVIGVYEGTPNEEETEACIGQLIIEH